MNYEYKMVQATPHHIIAQTKNIQTAAADYLQELVNEYAEQGWEFYRLDDFSTPTSCIYKVITFRREVVR